MSLPAEIGDLPALKRVNFSNNQLTTIPVKIGGLKELNSLILSGNQLAQFPYFLGALSQLEYLWLDRTVPRDFEDDLHPLNHLRFFFPRWLLRNVSALRARAMMLAITRQGAPLRGLAEAPAHIREEIARSEW